MLPNGGRTRQTFVKNDGLGTSQGNLTHLVETGCGVIWILGRSAETEPIIILQWSEHTPHVRYLLWTSILFAFVFFLEIVIKIIGMTLLGMLSSWRNR